MVEDIPLGLKLFPEATITVDSKKYEGTKFTLSLLNKENRLNFDRHQID